MINGIYALNSTFYTGTDKQPDTITLFFHSPKEEVNVYQKMATANWIGYIPLVGTIGGVQRVYHAVK